jgi:hypothetical protein
MTSIGKTGFQKMVCLMMSQVVFIAIGCQSMTTTVILNNSYNYSQQQVGVVYHLAHTHIEAE